MQEFGQWHEIIVDAGETAKRNIKVYMSTAEVAANLLMDALGGQR